LYAMRRPTARGRFVSYLSRMDTSKPEDIQSDPSKRPSTEIQAHPPPPRADPPPLRDFNFKQPPFGGALRWIVILVLFGLALVEWSLSFFGRVANKTFSNTIIIHEEWDPPGKGPWEIEQKRKKELEEQGPKASDK